MITIRVSADPYKDEVVSKYMGRFFEPFPGSPDSSEWKYTDSGPDPLDGILKEVKSSSIPQFADWNRTIDELKNSLSIY